MQERSNLVRWDNRKHCRGHYRQWSTDIQSLGRLDFGGVISGTGNVVKLGTGTLTLPGANTYTGATTVNGGSLIVDGSIASANTFVNPGGLLGGHGIIGGNLVNSGVVSPGSSPATLTVNGDYMQDPSGTLRIEVAGPHQASMTCLR